MRPPILSMPLKTNYSFRCLWRPYNFITRISLQSTRNLPSTEATRVKTCQSMGKNLSQTPPKKLNFISVGKSETLNDIYLFLPQPHSSKISNLFQTTTKYSYLKLNPITMILYHTAKIREINLLTRLLTIERTRIVRIVLDLM